MDVEGYVYVADQTNNRVQKFTTEGRFVSQWGGYGSGAGQLFHPVGIALGPEGYLYVVEHQNHRVSKFTRNGRFVGMWGTGNLYYPVAICVDRAGIFYVTQLGPLIQKFTADGVAVGAWYADGMTRPYGLASGPDGEILVADHDGGPIQRYTSTGTFLGYIGLPGSGSAPGQFKGPHGLRFDDRGDLFVADTFNDRVQQFDAAGGFLTLWGTTGARPGQFSSPVDVAFDGLGRIYVSDWGNSRIQVFQYQPTPTRSLSWGSIKARYRP